MGPVKRAESERFARVLEHPAEAREDHELAALTLIDDLRALGASWSPDAAARHRIHAGIVERRTPADGRAATDRKHPARILSAAVVLLLALGGLGMVLSRNALPGGPLYGVKRTGESATVGLTFGQQAKAQKHLEFADNRINELGRLTESGADDDAYVTGLSDFDSEVRAGVAQLTTSATESGSREELMTLRDWARRQAGKLAATRSGIPPAAISRFTSTQWLLNEIETRATALDERMDCYRITSGSSDQLGVLPAQGACEPPGTTRSDLAEPDGRPRRVVAGQTTKPRAIPDLPGQTPPLPPVSAGPLTPPVIGSPVVPAIPPRDTGSVTLTPPPLISILSPPPGLPAIVIP